MLKKINRGLSRKDFENSREKGRLIHGSCFSISLMGEGDHEGSPVQIGFVISKKISKRAVDRNRIKRLIAETIKKDVEQHQNLKLKHQKIIILVRKSILEASSEDIEKCWKTVYEKLMVLTQPTLTGPPSLDREG